MSHEITKSQFFVELSEQEQELVAGGFCPSKKPLPFGPAPFGPAPFGPALIKGGLRDKGFDGFPFKKDDE